MADVASSTTVSALVAALWSDVRALADEREVDLDLRLLGRPTELADESRNVVTSRQWAWYELARSAGNCTMLPLKWRSAWKALSVRIEHDGTLGTDQRLSAESGILANYGEVGDVGGTLVMSSGRGYGMRIELTVPYVVTGGPANVIPAPPSGIALAARYR